MDVRLVLPSLAAFAVVGCFNPSDDVIDPSDTDTDTESASGSMTDTMSSGGTSSDTSATSTPTSDGTTNASSTSTGDPDSSGTATGTPGGTSVDLTVDGDDGPLAIEHGRRLVLEADAMAEAGIDRVEFYDGDSLIATDTEAPYAAELVVTSQESGPHPLQARAFDADGEEAVDDVQVLVDIVGGTVEVSQTEILLVGGVLVHPGGGAVIDPEGNVVVVVPVISNFLEYIAAAAISYSPDLGRINWQITDPTTLAEGEPFRMPMGRPYLNEAEDEVVIGGTADDGGLLLGGENSVMFRYALDGSGPLPYSAVNHDAGSNAYGHAGLAVAPSGHVYLPGPDDDVSRFAPNDGPLTWAEAGGPAYSPQTAGVYRMTTDSTGAVLTESIDCADGECTAVLRKLRAIDGLNQFTESLVVPAASSFGYALGGSGVVEGDDIVSIFALTADGDSGVRFVRRAPDGAELVNTDVLAGGSYRVADVRGEPTGSVVAAGSRINDGVTGGWIGRFDLDGGSLWNAPLTFGESTDAVISITPTDDGQVVVVGFSDAGGGFGLYGGQLWVARVDL